LKIIFLLTLNYLAQFVNLSHITILNRSKEKKIKRLIFWIIIGISILFNNTLGAGLQAFDNINTPHTSKIDFSLDTGVGLISGLSREIVYPSFSSVNLYLSELKWEIDNIYFWGGSFSINFFNFCTLCGGYWKPFNGKSGNMNDFDWYYNNLPQWTHWSNHTIFIIDSYLYDINVSVPLFKKPNFIFSINSGFKQNFFSWNDKPNSYVYTSADINTSYEPGDPLHDYYGDSTEPAGISYEVLYSIPYLGVKFKYFQNTICIDSILAYSFLGWAQDHDHHILRQLHFYDSFKFCQVLIAGINGKIPITRNFYFNISTFFQNLFESRGSIIIYNDDNQYLGSNKDDAGIQYYTFSFLFSAGFVY